MDRLSTLRLLASAIELSSISEAARRHGLSTTSASRRLIDLEAAMGVRLLERTTRYVRPTEAGARFADRMSPLVAGIEAAFRAATEDGERPSGVLHVLARRSFAMMHVAPHLAAFCEAHPQVTVDLELTEAADIAPNEDIDIAIRLGAPAAKSLASTPLASGRRILAASPGYLARKGAPKTVDDLAAHACLAYRREAAESLWVFETADGKREISPAGPLRATNGDLLRQAAVDGLGVVLLPAWMLAHDIEAGRLVACLPEVKAWPAGYDREIAAVYRRAAPLSPKVAAFLAHLTGRSYEASAPPLS